MSVEMLLGVGMMCCCIAILAGGGYIWVSQQKPALPVGGGTSVVAPQSASTTSPSTVASFNTAYTPSCTKIRADPQYNTISSTPSKAWTETTRNTAIVIISNAGQFPVPSLQAMSNDVLLNYLKCV